MPRREDLQRVWFPSLGDGDFEIDPADPFLFHDETVARMLKMTVGELRRYVEEGSAIPW